MNNEQTLLKTVKNYLKQHIAASPVRDKGVVEAYDIWAKNYDAQSGNLMLDLDNIVFAELINNLEIENKTIADIGCGTGRHWGKLYSLNPTSLTGFDVSAGMLEKLKRKFPDAVTYSINDNRFSAIADHNYDLIISTLTVAHIENIEEALNAWCRILKGKGDIIITDFHPDALASGGKRTFRNGNTHISVQNFVHSTAEIKEILTKNGMQVVSEIEKPVDETVKHYYSEQNAMHVYSKFAGSSIIYGIHFRRG